MRSGADVDDRVVAAGDDRVVHPLDRLVHPVLVRVALGIGEPGVEITVIALDRLHGEEGVVEQAGDVGSELDGGNRASFVERHLEIDEFVEGISGEAAVENRVPPADRIGGLTPEDLVERFVTGGRRR